MAPLNPVAETSEDAMPPQASQRYVTCYAIGMGVVFLLPFVFLVAIGLLVLRGLITG
jgi:hypothetical protein